MKNDDEKDYKALLKARDGVIVTVSLFFILNTSLHICQTTLLN